MHSDGLKESHHQTNAGAVWSKITIWVFFGFFGGFFFGGGGVEEEETQVVQVHVDFCLLSLLHPEAKTWNSNFLYYGMFERTWLLLLAYCLL